MGAIDRLIGLSHHRWALPILAEIHIQAGVRFVVLVNRMGIPRDTASRTLRALIGLRLVRRNPGYGHPLRPEYILTARGKRIAPACVELAEVIARQGIGDLAYRKWTLPIVAVLSNAEGDCRFSELKSGLPGITPRALATSLKELESANLIERRIDDGYPPSARYRNSKRGRDLVVPIKRITGT